MNLKQIISYISIVIFSVFVGSQITEGVLLVPYWQSLSSSEFYSYYKTFGPSIGKFYTVLTIIAALIPIFLMIYCKVKKSPAFNSALVSSIFAILFISAFFIYFKGANELFYNSALSDTALKRELVTWSYWHWGRIIIEIISLAFLIMSIAKFQKKH